MRTLTLGVLIVSGGTLAALPFRRYQALPDASSTPAQVTGPTHSALDRSQLDASESLHVSAGEEESAVAVTEPDVDVSMLVNQLPPPPPPFAPRPRRNLDIPLSFEDLAQPIDQPQAIQQRFNATAAAREQQRARESIAGLVMPELESLAITQQQELERVADQARESAARAGGSLASSTTRDLDRLPEPNPQERQRHWIRQPD